MKTSENSANDRQAKELLITHLFEAPRELVFAAWTNPAHLRHWYAPDGCTIEFRSIDVRERGAFHSCIHDPVHGACWIKGVYLEVSAPEKLVYTMVLTNENGDSVESMEAGKPEDWPEEILTTVTFTAVGNHTKLTLHQTVAEENARQTGAYQSWIKMLNKLDAMLATAS
ncbi:SRPBCC family protein [Hufsiella ginkgonis]|uniref:SRPBCC domain-containing protein n=1 Tax=Hufsiella ginkgonis TaxID=2695274 RepID=A0A7K1XX06_9SPHI|nr:SRPBCC domain-containing protein [Hufsiella ginkgonis]MXV15338.1 SRPBCC domain-containing protein [Hufsiella ginkgonis]